MTVIISSRRNSTREMAHRLSDELQAILGNKTIHRGVERISVPGKSLTDAIAHEAGQCTALLVLIDRDWLDDGKWLNNPKDFNAIAINAALSNSRQVIPVLIDGARLPAASDLPSTMQALASQQAVDLNAGVSQGVQSITSRIQQGNAPAQAQPASRPSPAPAPPPARSTAQQAASPKPMPVPMAAERAVAPSPRPAPSQQVITPSANVPNIAAQASQKVDMVVAQTTAQVDLSMIPHAKSQARTVIPANTPVAVIARDIKTEWLNVGYVSTVGEVLPGWIPVSTAINYSLKGRSVQLLDVKISDYGTNSMEDMANLIKLKKAALRMPGFIMSMLWLAAIAAIGVNPSIGAVFGVGIFIVSLVLYTIQTREIHEELKKLEEIRKSKRTPGQAAKEAARQAAKQAAAAAGLAAIVGAALLSANKSNKK